MHPAVPTPRQAPQRWDIFCRVIDNFGDIGVCWRLARQLASEHSLQVRLWVDDLVSLSPLCPAVASDATVQSVDGVEIRQWPVHFPEISPAEVGDIVIEAFACELPANYLAAMAAAKPTPGWINLEYLSAEPWVESCHRVASPHPALPLIKHFFFPGFTAKTGGLLCERGLLAQRDVAMAALPASDALQVSLFCYDTAPLGQLIAAWSQHPQPIHCHVAAGKPTAALTRLFGHAGPWQRGALTLSPIPFLSQDDYDRLLWQCDLNLVRGEDSFARAQWAGKPLLWHIYPQAEDAHRDKLDAFLSCYTAALNAQAQQALHDLFQAWNGDGSGIAASWPAFARHLPDYRAHAEAWAAQLAGLGDLAENLVKFCTYEL